MVWTSVCKVADVDEDLPKAVEVNGKKIGVFSIDSAIYAIENVCPHAYALLTEGFIEGDTVECPLHEAIFNITTGELEDGPGCRNLSIYQSRIQNDMIELNVD
ncbi:non-heme iron oxygenase ferredoxin subunit [Acinetobacter apis]|uniref:3-phenylpropionate/trans-cinnamate dioxygenase ferredoxin subunit n=1 Tax=Acinetobacter apis TaxID=1229165 RepID=A0A217EEX9_9GAMM|nr:non-heme iron oxygenase ferredoxin subunit [Acinetobacter apis]SNQ28760.1 3-phenylpropionate/trans-cinnamate dioxygenase ferredoxin subunit [Acinetobacter apis]